MDKKWTAWPGTKLGKTSVALTGLALLVWLLLPAFVQLRERTDLAASVGLTLVVVLFALSLSAVVLGWVSFGVKKDKSILLLVSACVLSAILVVTVVGELIEGAMMGAF